MKNLWLVFVLGLATGYISEKLLVSSQLSSSMTDDLYLEGRPSGDFPIDDEDGDDSGSGSGSGSGDYFLSDVIEAESVTRKFLVNMSETAFKKEISIDQPRTTESPYNLSASAAASQDPSTTAETTVAAFLFPGREEEKELEEKLPKVHPTSNRSADITNQSSTSPSPNETTSAKFNTEIIVPKDAKDTLTEDGRGDVTVIETEKEVLTKEVRDDLLAKGRYGGKVYELDSPEDVTSENLWERTEVLAAVIACGVVGFVCAVLLLLLLAYRMKKKDEGSYDLGDTKLSATAYHKAPTKEFYA